MISGRIHAGQLAGAAKKSPGVNWPGLKSWGSFVAFHDQWRTSWFALLAREIPGACTGFTVGMRLIAKKPRLTDRPDRVSSHRRVARCDFLRL